MIKEEKQYNRKLTIKDALGMLLFLFGAYYAIAFYHMSNWLLDNHIIHNFGIIPSAMNHAPKIFLFNLSFYATQMQTEGQPTFISMIEFSAFSILAMFIGLMIIVRNHTEYLMNEKTKFIYLTTSLFSLSILLSSFIQMFMTGMHLAAYTNSLHYYTLFWLLRIPTLMIEHPAVSVFIIFYGIWAVKTGEPFEIHTRPLSEQYMDEILTNLQYIR